MYHTYLPISVHCIGFKFYNKKFFSAVDFVFIIFAPTHVYYILIHHQFTEPVYTICLYIHTPLKKK